MWCGEVWCWGDIDTPLSETGHAEAVSPATQCPADQAWRREKGMEHAALRRTLYLACCANTSSAPTVNLNLPV